MQNRGIRHSVVATISCAALLLAGCSSGDPDPTGLTPSASASPTASPSTTPTHPSNTGRDSGMTDLEALARLLTPQTGETWFDTPVQISTPSWAIGDEYLDQDWVTWYELGARDGRSIVGFSAEAVQEIFEMAGDGTWEWIPFPSARATVTPTADSFGYDEVPTNTSLYYDSLTLPAVFTLPTGEPLLTPEYDWGSPGIPGRESLTPEDGEVVEQIGGYEVLRIAGDARWIWSDVYAVTAPVGLTYEEFMYVLGTPYGMFIPLEYAPLGELTDITWAIPTSIATDGYTSLADINDIGCGPRDSDHNTTVFGTQGSDWVQAGTTAHGDKVYIPTATNPLTQPMYDSYTAFKEGYGETPVSLEQFLNGPALIGYKAPGTGDWVVYLNGAYSGRAWC
ncbi:MAG: hypothetical protein JW722_01835 [Demequinaceae bacterium]|nr:hypothetical protein [Demequinaceae bacterium]